MNAAQLATRLQDPDFRALAMRAGYVAGEVCDAPALARRIRAVRVLDLVQETDWVIEFTVTSPRARPAAPRLDRRHRHGHHRGTPRPRRLQLQRRDRQAHREDSGMSEYTKVITRPDPRVPGAWCQEGATHDHDACGALWNSASSRDVGEAARWAEERGDRLRRQITVTRTKIRLIERDGTWVFGVTFPEREEFVMSSHATAAQLAEVIASARAQQIRVERAQTAPPAAVGDVLGAHDPIPANVTEVRNGDGLWRRAVGDERYPVEEDGTVDRTSEYDWVTVNGGGWASTDGLYDYPPITITGVQANA